jgi:two-component system nitrate/nitrite response regulator NarL
MVALPIRVVIIDPFLIIRRGLRLMLEEQPGLLVVGEAGDSIQALKVVADKKPDIILLKLYPAGGLGLEVISKLIKASREARIILMTTTEELQFCLQAIREGVLGLVSKLQTPEVLVKAIKKVHSGEVWIEHSMMARLLSTDNNRTSKAGNHEMKRITQLSDREYELIRLISRGLKNKQIASQLSISESTVRHHLTSIYSKLGVSDRLELLVFAHRNSLDKVPE